MDARKKTWGKKSSLIWDNDALHCRYGCISSANCTYGTIQALVRSLISLTLVRVVCEKTLGRRGFIHESWSSLHGVPKSLELPNLFWGNWCVSSHLYDWKIDSNESCCQIWMWMNDVLVVVWVFRSHSLFGVFFFAKKKIFSKWWQNGVCGL